MNHSTFEDVSSKPTSVGQCIQDVFPDEVLKIPTWFTQSIAPTDGITDTEALADEMVECGFTGDDIPPMFAGSEFNICIALDCINGFSLDECQIVAIVAFLVWLPRDEGSGFYFAEISVTPKATSSDGLNFTAFSHLDFGFRSSEDAFDSSNTVHIHRV